MLTVQRTRFWSNTYAIRDGRREVTEVNVRWTREAGSFVLDGTTFEVGRAGWASGDFFLSRDGERLASADKASAFRRRFVIDVDGESFELAAASIWARTYELRRGTRRVGSIRRTSLWANRADVDLPETLPMEVRVFITWLVLVMWKRSDDSNS